MIRFTEGGFQPKADEPLAQIRASEKPLLLSYPVFCVLANQIQMTNSQILNMGGFWSFKF
ncbi:hypothetical protein B5M47_00640 [candidate division CPR3 bacterium 4484_211]|uniref:Uncharacterized protein n=1 Tax=candidate division CPR3 bacterium 4484_211 TaxID=1968527 RepID=A0A1W9NZC8_UNCC3|nr:MAG: hypothetical protein B5M47_00640 [candidate division CPR3 bacterium 4484_211]